MKGRNVWFVPMRTPQKSQFQPLLQGVVVTKLEVRRITMFGREKMREKYKGS